MAWTAAEAALRRVSLHLVHGFATLPFAEENVSEVIPFTITSLALGGPIS